MKGLMIEVCGEWSPVVLGRLAGAPPWRVILDGCAQNDRLIAQLSLLSVLGLWADPLSIFKACDFHSQCERSGILSWPSFFYDVASKELVEELAQSCCSMASLGQRYSSALSKVPQKPYPI